MFDCHALAPPSPPLDIPAAIIEAEIDRIYKSARPGFVREWVSVGFEPDGALFGDLIVHLDSTAHAQAFSDWLDQDFVLDGTLFWNRADFTLGHECHIFEILGSVDRPSTTATQVMERVERFQIKGADARQRLQAMWEPLKVEAMRRGDSSIFLLYSEPLQTAEVMYFEDLPLKQRSLLSFPIPISTRPSYVERPLTDRSSWVTSIWFPFQPVDSGQPAIWPLPGIEPWNGDGVCELSRHESFRTSEDCLATCGNGVPDPGETQHNCPSDVPL